MTMIADSSTLTIDRIAEALGGEADYYLNHKSTTIDKTSLYLPGPDFVGNVYSQTDRNPQVLRSLGQMFNHGRLANTGYLSILPVDQGIEHSAGASFAKNPIYFDAARSSSWRSKAAATPSPRPSACSARWPANTRTKSRSWSRSTITSC